jgi:predicted nucleic acid-binding protein
MTSEDLRLAIERGVVAILADQHLSEQRRRREAAGDRPLRRRHLRHGAAGPAGVFRPDDAQHAELRRHPVQYLGLALADAVHRAAAARAGLARYVELDLLARQMAGQRLAS